MDPLKLLEEQTEKELCTESEPLYFAPGSRECPNGSRLVFGKGPIDARIVFVGSNPGRKENETGEPFTGVAGKQLADLCSMYDIDLRSIYVTNVIKLALFGQRQQPSDQDIVRHSKYLERQIQLIQPRLVVALGNVAAKTLLYLFPNGNLDMTSHQEADLQIKRINGHTHDLGFSYTVVTTFNPVMYTDESYRKPLERGFKAINHEIRKDRISLNNVFDVRASQTALAEHPVASVAQTKTRQEIEQAIEQQLEPDEDASETFDQIQAFFQALSDDSQSVNNQTFQEVATQFDLSVDTVKDINWFTVSQPPDSDDQPTLKRSRSPSDLPSPKRNKPLTP